MLKYFLLTGLLLLAGASAAPVSPYCPVNVFIDYTVGFAYYAQLQLSAGCEPGQVARVRRSSTVSTIRNGAAFQPIDPPTGAWTVTEKGDNVPNEKQITYRWSTWVWEYYDGLAKKWERAVLQ